MSELLYGSQAGDLCECEDWCRGHIALEDRPKLTPAAATAVRDFIVDLDDSHTVTPAEATRLWKALQARCPHITFSSAGDPSPTCDACQIPIREAGLYPLETS